MRDGASWRVIGILDDEPSKIGLILHSTRVLGGADEATLRRVVEEHKVQVAVLAIPSAPTERVRDIVKHCRALGLEVKTVPSLTDRMAGNGGLPAMREINIEDLLRREPAVLDLTQVGDFLSGKVVLVTGAGGSIGSELARQSLRFAPRQLILLEQDENALFFIERELREKFPTADVVAVLGDITNAVRVNELFASSRPQIVLHAAAHKHVGMLENNSSQAVRNNVFGTFTVAQAAHDSGVEAFVLISTDKAVNPTSVMGATKRVTEMIMQQMAQMSRTRFTAVRFGNVLGSAGSVVPLFRAQIAAGGPVTVTHPDVRRYFMTIPEASQLVLQAGALGGTGEIFLLDMGEPVKVLDLARDLISLSGLRPDIDIEIKFTGLKSGEKLFEEMLLGDEGYDATSNPQIVVGRIQATPRQELEEGLDRLLAASMAGDDREVRLGLSALVPEATLVMPEVQPEPIRRSSHVVRRNGTMRIKIPDAVNQPTPLRVSRLLNASEIPALGRAS
jgi:FlaA1/EpsC-like NDP-sugar epimerase